MKSLKYLALCLVAALVTTSCSNDENEPQVSLKEGKPVKFEMSIAKTNTRTVTTGSGNNRVVDWRVGDAVGIFVYNETTPLGSGNYKYVFDGTDWVAASTSDAINLQDGENYSFYAYYPYSATGIASATNATLSVQTDQTTKDETTQNTGYDLSDILTAQTPNVSNGGTVALQFKHAFSMVEVLVAGDLVPSAPGSVILKNVATSAGINLTTGVVGATNANADVTMCLIESDPTKTTYLYRAIVPAQTVLANNTLLEVHGVGENGNKNYEFAHTEAVPYEQGKYRRIEVQIGKVEAGIKIPGGAIDEWTPSGGIDVPGKEMIVNLITIPISTLTQESLITYLSNGSNKDDWKTSDDQWYIYTDVSAATISAVVKDGGITITPTATSVAHWAKGAFGFHHKTAEKTPIENKLYQLSITGYANKVTQLRIFIRNEYTGVAGEVPVSYNWFFPQNNSISANASIDLTTESNTYTKVFDFSRITSSTSGDGNAASIYSTPEDLNKVYGCIDIRIVPSTKANEESEFTITDIKLVPYTAE